MKLAIEEAEKSNCRYKVGAVVFKNSSILSSGHNAKRANSIHPKYQVWPHSLHAEQAALLGLDWHKLKNASIFVLRLTKAQKLSLAKPCQTCQNLLAFVGIKKVFYTGRSGEILLDKI